MPTLLYQGTLNVPVQKILGIPNFTKQPDGRSFDAAYWASGGLSYTTGPGVGFGNNINAAQLIQLFNGGVSGWNEIDFSNDALLNAPGGTCSSHIFNNRVYSFISANGRIYYSNYPLPPIAFNTQIAYTDKPGAITASVFPVNANLFIHNAWTVALLPGFECIAVYHNEFGFSPGFYFLGNGIDIGPRDYPGSNQANGIQLGSAAMSPDVSTGYNYLAQFGVDVTNLGVLQIWNMQLVSSSLVLELLQDSQTIFIDALGVANSLAIVKGCKQGFVLQNPAGTVAAFANRTLTQYFILTATDTTGAAQAVKSPTFDESGYMTFQNANGLFTSYPAPLNYVNPFSSVYTVPMFPISIPCFDPCAFPRKRNS